MAMIAAGAPSTRADSVPFDAIDAEYQEGVPVAFSELQQGWWVGVCYAAETTTPAFHIATSGFSKTFAAKSPSPEGEVEKGFGFALLYDSDQAPGKATPVELESFERQKTAVFAKARGRSACWDSRSTDSACAHYSQIASTTDYGHQDWTKYGIIFPRKSGDAYVSLFRIPLRSGAYSQQYRCHQVRAEISGD